MPRTRTVPDAGGGPNDLIASATTSSAVEAAEPVAEQPPSGPAGLPSVSEQWASHLRRSIPALFTYASMKLAFPEIDENAYRIYRDRLLADCGSPSDPIEAMLVEQLALAHFNFGVLQCRAANAPKVDAAGIYAACAARLMAEFRRSAIALQAYRAASRQLAGPSPKDAIVLDDELARIGEEPREKSCTTEMGSPARDVDDDPPVIPMPRAATS